MEGIQTMLDFLKTDPPVGPALKPQTIAEVGVRQAVLEDLALKILYLSGSLSILELSDKIRLSFEVANELFARMRAERYCQVTGMKSNIPQIAITSEGRSRAMELLSHSHYAGAAPVSLESYVEQTRKQGVQNVSVGPADVKRAFAHLVIDDKTLAQFGTALNSGAALFLYGPPGTGKTTMAAAMASVLAVDQVWIPYAVEVDGQMITVFDPAVHKRISDAETLSQDDRWVLCRRPTILVGGELTVEMLDMQFNPITKFYVGPVQMKANNGVLVIDDFGRQRLRPEELLNRWVVPLDRRIDFLTLAGGRKIEIPFEMLVVFASNLDPYGLVDAAFLRRIQTKIKVGSITDDQFREIFRRVVQDREIAGDEGIADELIEFVRETMKQELRSCFPRDIVNQICWEARYEGRKPYLNSESLKRAVEAYFLPRD